MNPFKHFMNFLTANTTGSATPQNPSPQQSQSTALPSGTASVANQQDGHVRRNKISFRPVGPNDVIEESEESWKRNGNMMEGDAMSTKAITASGQIADISSLQSICVICNRLEDTIIRSVISHLPLCRTCQRIFEKPNGEKIVVTPQEYELLDQNFNTWEHFDTKRKGADQ